MPKFKKGDRVRVTNGSAKGRTGTVDEDSCIPWVSLDYQTGLPTRDVCDEDRLELIDKPKSKFKMGDKVRVLKKGGEITNAHKDGSIGVVVKTRSNNCSVKVSTLSQYVSHEDLELVDKTKFKVGDKVMNKDGDADTVQSVPGMSEYDSQCFSSASTGFVLVDLGWEVQEDWEAYDYGLAVRRKMLEGGLISTSTPRGNNDFYDRRTKGFTATHDGFLRSRQLDWSIRDEYYQPKKERSLMQRLTARLKRALNKDLQAIYKVGWINGDLEVTEDGHDALCESLMDTHEKAMGELARAKIKEIEDKAKKA